MSIRHLYDHTWTVLSQPHLPLLYNGKVIPALPNVNVVEMFGWEFLRTTHED